MKTPTLEEVKKYFKNVKEVICLSDGIKYSLEDMNKRGIHEYSNSYWFTTKNYADVKIFDNGRYAEIISYKESQKTDSIVESVINQFKERSEAGINKYGTTLDRNDLTTLEWINHAQQEAMDFCLYLEKLKKEYMK